MSRCRFLLRVTSALVFTALCALVSPVQAAQDDHPKLDRPLNRRAKNPLGHSRVIVRFKPGLDGSAAATELGGKLGRRLGLVNGIVVELSNGQLKKLADHPTVDSLHHDRNINGSLNRVAVTTGARGVQHVYGFTGAGVGVAVIDSGVTAWHDDLTYAGANPAVRTVGGQRIAAFVDYVKGYKTPYDDHGHGTHVSGIIAGNGYDTRGVRAGMAPDAHIVSLKVLDGNGRGYISNVIAALEYAIANRAAYNIRIVNLSVGAPVTESFNTDPLTLAAKRAVDAGIVVVAAAGNLGKNRYGLPQKGGITAPANAPWVLTVGATNHQGTVTRVDDVLATYSSRGPTAIDFAAKPDVVAPGSGIVSLSSRNSLLYLTKPSSLLGGTLLLGYKPYQSLTGTSMAAPVVAGTVALMMQANPNLTPNLVKAVLQYTAQNYSAYDELSQGAGFLNTRGAVDLVKYFATAQPGQPYFRQHSNVWSRQIIWGNHRLTGGAISPTANAWHIGQAWGAAADEDGDNIVWGTDCETEDCDNIVWGTFEDGDNIVWGTADINGYDEDGDNIVWGTHCATGGSLEDCDNIVWGTVEDGDNIVWGTDCAGEDCDNIVWGTAQLAEDGVWGIAEDGDNIVWGTGCDATIEDCDNIVWGTSGVEEVTFDDPYTQPTEYQSTDWEALFAAEALTSMAPLLTVLTTGGSL